jgi:hypothetical protein
MPLTDFVSATPDELRSVCRGWPTPLDVPRVETRTNPPPRRAARRASVSSPSARSASSESKGLYFWMSP